MSTTNRIHNIDDVRIVMYLDGREVDAHQGSGYHTVDEAVRDAFNASSRTNMPIEDYVFRVTDLSNDTTARYRINAGGHLRILPEE